MVHMQHRICHQILCPKHQLSSLRRTWLVFIINSVLCFRKRIMWSLIILFLYGNTGFVYFSLIYCLMNETWTVYVACIEGIIDVCNILYR